MALTKKEFQKKYMVLSETDKAKVKEYHEGILKSAIFIDTYEIAEKCLLWIRELEGGL